jgi:hypothetical protein
MKLCFEDEISGNELMLEAALTSKPEEAARIEGTAQMISVQKHAVNREIPELTSEEKAILFDIRNNDPCYLGPFAQTVLEIFGGEAPLDLESACLVEQSTKSAKRTIKQSHDIMLFPNPVSNDYATLKLSEPLNEPTIAEIWSIDTKLMRTIPIQQGQQDVAIWMSNLDKGVYLIKMTIRDQPIIISIVKI